jgi:FRG domain protein
MREYSVKYVNLTNKIKKLYPENDKQAKNVTSFVRGNTIKVETYHDLIMEIAELSYKNPDVMLFFRGQNNHYIKKKHFTLYPSIYRSSSDKDINFDYEILERSSKQLVHELEKNNNVDGDEIKDIKKIKLLQYSILQHYEVCKTPLLDVSQSLKVACSFAILNNKNKVGYIFVLGLPYINGRISIDSEEYITNIRLLSISSSSSKRPFFQEGYLIQNEFTSEGDLEKGELDFNRRIVAVYEFENDGKFWGSEQPISVENLYPEVDIMKEICNKIKEQKYDLNVDGVDEKSIGKFLTLWNKLEEDVRDKTQYNNFMQGINHIIDVEEDNLYKDNLNNITSLRQFRNILVHDSNKIRSEKLNSEIINLKNLLNTLNISG